MPRTNSAEVQQILLDDYDGSSALDAFIDTATVIVDRVKTCATNKGKSLTAGELRLIERWLAAHLYCMSDQPYAAKTTSKASATFQGQTGLNLDGTKYGQTAKTIDYSGCLESISKRQVAGAVWLGKPPSTQTDYVDRD